MARLVFYYNPIVQREKRVLTALDLTLNCEEDSRSSLLVGEVYPILVSENLGQVKQDLP